MQIENGKIFIENSAMLALREAQDAFKGEAAGLGLENDQDVVDMVKEAEYSSLLFSKKGRKNQNY